MPDGIEPGKPMPALRLETIDTSIITHGLYAPLASKFLHVSPYHCFKASPVPSPHGSAEYWSQLSPVHPSKSQYGALYVPRYCSVVQGRGLVAVQVGICRAALAKHRHGIERQDQDDEDDRAKDQVGDDRLCRGNSHLKIGTDIMHPAFAMIVLFVSVFLSVVLISPASIFLLSLAVGNFTSIEEIDQNEQAATSVSCLLNIADGVG
jgi:hypothetical protein